MFIMCLKSKLASGIVLLWLMCLLILSFVEATVVDGKYFLEDVVIDLDDRTFRFDLEVHDTAGNKLNDPFVACGGRTREAAGRDGFGQEIDDGRRYDGSGREEAKNGTSGFNILLETLHSNVTRVDGARITEKHSGPGGVAQLVDFLLPIVISLSWRPLPKILTLFALDSSYIPVSS